MVIESQQATKKPRVAIYGGAFDPVHNAHLGVAQAALGQVSLDELVFVPAAHSPLKALGAVATGEQRLKMLELAVGEMAGLSVSDVELKRKGVSYTIDTVRDFIVSHPDVELFWIIGGDQFEQLDRWRDIGDLAKMVTFLVVARPGHDLTPPPVPGLVWAQVKAPLMNESSTLIRERIAKGESTGGLMAPAVEAFIRENELYT